MRFPVPWSTDPESWKEYVPEISHPGVEAEEPGCLLPPYGTPPVVHRFHDLFLTQDRPFDFTTADEFGDYLVENVENPCTPCPETRCIRPWEVQQVRCGIFVVYEQAWHWKGTSLGELIGSITLAPLEELEIQVFTWDRTKLSHDLETTDLVDKKSETSLTTHDSAHVVSRMEKEKEWQLGANLGFEYGVTVGTEVSVGESVRDADERGREQKQERTSKTAQQIRSERRIKISTVRETGVEERTRRLLKNHNPTRSVTYHFYETISHYQVDIAPVELRWVVAIPNQLPEITPCWVVCHEGILRDHLLDETQEPGFQAARGLTKPEKFNLVAEAACRLYDAFVAQPVRTGVRPERVPFLERELRLREGGAPDSSSTPQDWELQEQLVAKIDAHLDRYPPADWSSFLSTREYLKVVRDQPTVTGLRQALWVLRAWLLEKPSDAGSLIYPVTPELEGAIGFALAVVDTYVGGELYGLPPYPAPGMTGGANPETEPSPDLPVVTQPSEPPQNEEDWREAQIARALDKSIFDGLKCHIEENLLQYMRPIWLAEDPGIRRALLSQRLLGSGMSLLDSLIDEPLVGFHLNCSVFPVKMDAELEAKLREALRSGTVPNELSSKAVHTFIAQVNTHGANLKKRVQEHYGQLANARFEADARHILNSVMAESLQRV